MRDSLVPGCRAAFTLLATISLVACSPAGATATGAPPSAPSAPSTAITDPPVPPKADNNPFKGKKLWVDPDSQAAGRSNALRATAPDKAALLDRIAKQPQAVWLGEWSGNVAAAVRRVIARAKPAGELPVFVAYNVPYRDCGQYSKGGLSGKDAYRTWIRQVYEGLGDGEAVFILEPDALGLLDKCLSPEQQAERLGLVKDAVRVLRQSSRVGVYIDAGHARWVKADVMAERLKGAGIAEAHGFALNTSNYVTTEENTQYGTLLSGLVGGAHFVIDTSRNGAGPAPKDEWCNPPGRKLGALPTSETGAPLVDAWLWIKRPGESDGDCNGGPRSGSFWDEQAIELAK